MNRLWSISDATAKQFLRGKPIRFRISNLDALQLKRLCHHLERYTLMHHREKDPWRLGSIGRYAMAEHIPPGFNFISAIILLDWNYDEKMLTSGTTDTIRGNRLHVRGAEKCRTDYRRSKKFRGCKFKSPKNKSLKVQQASVHRIKLGKFHFIKQNRRFSRKDQIESTSKSHNEMLWNCIKL